MKKILALLRLTLGGYTCVDKLYHRSTFQIRKNIFLIFDQKCFQRQPPMISLFSGPVFSSIIISLLLCYANFEIPHRLTVVFYSCPACFYWESSWSEIIPKYAGIISKRQTSIDCSVLTTADLHKNLIYSNIIGGKGNSLDKSSPADIINFPIFKSKSVLKLTFSWFRCTESQNEKHLLNLKC